MFIPFLAAAAVARRSRRSNLCCTGAMSVKIAVLTLALQAISIAFLALAPSDIALLARTQRGVLNRDRIRVAKMD